MTPPVESTTRPGYAARCDLRRRKNGARNKAATKPTATRPVMRFMPFLLSLSVVYQRGAYPLGGRPTSGS